MSKINKDQSSASTLVYLAICMECNYLIICQCGIYYELCGRDESISSSGLSVCISLSKKVYRSCDHRALWSGMICYEEGSRSPEVPVLPLMIGMFYRYRLFWTWIQIIIDTRHLRYSSAIVLFSLVLTRLKYN